MRPHDASSKRSIRRLHTNHKLLRKLLARLQHDLLASEIMSALTSMFQDAIVKLGPTTLADTKFTASGLERSTSPFCIVWEDHIRDGTPYTSTSAHARTLVSVIPVTNISYRVLTIGPKDAPRDFDKIDRDFVTTCALLLFTISIADRGPAKYRSHWIRDSIELLQGLPLSKTTLLKDFMSRITNVDVYKEYNRLLGSFVHTPLSYNGQEKKQSLPHTLLQLDDFEAQIIEALRKVIKWSYVEKTCVFFERQVPQGVALVVHDKSAILDCVIPLMMNALENTLQGSVVVRYSTHEFSNLILDIKDTGCGGCTATSSTVGSGGLPTARATAKAMHGSIDLVSSSPTAGSLFRIILKDIAFATPRTQSGGNRRYPALPPSYCLLQPAEGNSSGVRAFLRMLESLDLKKTSETRGQVLVVIPFCPVEGDYEQLLTVGRDALACVSLVPNRADITDMRSKFPETLFYTCPFTTMRMTEMLRTLNDVCAAYSGQRTSACGSARSSIMQAYES